MLHRLWPALEEIPGLEAVSAEWRTHLGEGSDSLQSLLIPTDRFAESIPVADDPYTRYRVVRHSPDDIVGIHDGGRPPIKLSKRDVLIYRLDHQRIAREVATALGIKPALAPADGVPHTYCVGAFRPFAGFSFPAFLAIPLESDDLQRAAEAIAARYEGPFILAAPTCRCLSPQCEQLLRARGAYFFALSESIAADGGGKFAATEVAQLRLAEFQKAVVPPTGPAVGVVFFPTPADATWKDVRIKFVDGHTVSVKAGTESRTLTYSQMGMADGRNAKPDKQWELLSAFARKNGTLTWDDPAAHKNNQKRCETLNAGLGQFFRIEGKAIEYVSDIKGWQTQFTIEPDV